MSMEPRGAVGPDGEAVGFVGQALQVVEHRTLGLEHEGGLTGHEEPFQAGVPVLGGRKYGLESKWSVGSHHKG